MEPNTIAITLPPPHIYVVIRHIRDDPDTHGIGTKGICIAVPEEFWDEFIRQYPTNDAWCLMCRAVPTLKDAQLIASVLSSHPIEFEGEGGD